MVTKFKVQLVDKFQTLIAAAFGLVAALAWNDAIKQMMVNAGLTEYGPIWYAIIVTVIAVIVTLILARIASRLK